MSDVHVTTIRGQTTNWGKRKREVKSEFITGSCKLQDGKLIFLITRWEDEKQMVFTVENATGLYEWLRNSIGG